jgi:long-chain acyl-CoA synthetase
VAAMYVPQPQDSMTDALFDHAARWPDQVAFGRRVDGVWLPVTCKEFADQVVAVAGGLIAAGIAAGDRVGLFSRTRFEWMVGDFAIWTAGAITVPVYETSSAEQVEWELRDSGAVAVIVEMPEHARTVAQVRPALPALRAVWTIEEGALDELAASGREVPLEQVMARRDAVTARSVATIVYTSGTTGRPKGCVITHGNLLFEMENVVRAPGVAQHVLNESRSTLLFLPLAHILARMIQVSAVRTRVRLGHTGDLANLPAQLAEFRPTSVLSVPRVFEKIYNAAAHSAAVQGRARIFALAEATAVDYSRSLDSGGRGPGPGLRLRHAIFDRLVYSRLRAAMGGRVEYAVSGGAPLGARLGHFFRGVGVIVLEGYGLTETCAGATLNLPGAQRIGTVGRPIPGCSIRIAPDGEVLIKGGHVFEGYWQDEAATREVLDEDGWFRSGDLGELDQDGYLTITGRKKDLIVTSSGKNVAPAVLEDRLRAHWLVSQCVVVGDARPYVGALVTLDAEVFSQWKVEHGKPNEASVAELREDADLLTVVRGAVDEANKAVSAAEAIKRFRVLTADFSVEGGELTPTLKVKRQVVFGAFSQDVEALYLPEG